MTGLRAKHLPWIAAAGIVAVLGGALIWSGVGREAQNRVYRIGWHPDPPFQAVGTDGRATGLAVELVREAAKRRGIRIEWVSDDGGVDSALREGRVDLWPVLTIIPERAAYFHLTEPYLESSYSFVVRAGSGFEEVEDLAAAPISHNGTRINVRNLRMLLPQAHQILVDGATAALDEVCRQHADAAFVEEFTALAALANRTCTGEKLRLIPVAKLRTSLGVGSTFASAKAADAIRDEIGKIAGEPELPAALLRWGPFMHRNLQSLQAFRDEKRWRRLLTVLVGIVFGVLMVTVWLTRRIVRERQKAIDAERELGTTQQNYRLLAEQAADGIALADADGRFLVTNSHMCEMLGYGVEEMGALSVRESYVAQDGESAWDRIAAIPRKANLRFEGEMRRRDGSVIPVEANIVRLGDGRLQQIVRDITERRKSEAALRESEERFRNMADTAPVMIWMADPQGQYTFFNKTWLHFTGRTMAQEFGEGWSLGVHFEDLQRSHEVFRSATQSRKEFRTEYRLRRADGEHRWVLCCGVPRFDPNGVFAGYIGSNIDITDLQSEERFRQLAENLEQVFWMLDLENDRVLYVSPAFERVWGRNSAALYQNRGALKESVYEEDRDRLNAFLAKVRSEAADEVYRIVRPDGSIRWIHDRSFLVRGEGGKPYRVAGIAEDITAHRELEEQLRHAQKMDAVGRLAGGIAHDFNNLLTVIVGYSQMLLDDCKMEDPRRARLDQVLYAANRAATLTGQLLAFSRRQKVQPKTVGVNHLLAEMETMLRRLIGEHLTVETSLHPDVDCIQIDPHQLEQVILNLATNARDAMPNGGRFRIESSLLDAEAAGEEGLKEAGSYVRLRISDNGCGMDRRTRERAFEPFFTTKGVGKGTGLGLSIVYGIVQQNQGTIRVSSELGEGTVFELYFPAVDGEGETRDHSKEPLRKRSGETVLLAEDEPAVRGLVRNTLEQLGYSVLEAADGYEALRVAEESGTAIHLLLTDVIMPLMNGHELATRLESIRPGMRVLYMSGYTDDMLEMHGVKRLALIQKPFTASELAEKLRGVLAGAKAAG